MSDRRSNHVKELQAKCQNLAKELRILNRVAETTPEQGARIRELLRASPTGPPPKAGAATPGKGKGSGGKNAKNGKGGKDGKPAKGGKPGGDKPTSDSPWKRLAAKFAPPPLLFEEDPFQDAMDDSVPTQASPAPP